MAKITQIQDMDNTGIGYNLCKREGVIKLHYHYKGFDKVIDIDSSQYEEEKLTIDEKDDYTHNIIKDHDAVKTIIKNDLINNVFASEEFKRWSVENHRCDYNKSQIFADSKDTGDTTGKIIRTAIDGSILVMEK